jgi:hypothetical protein
MKVFTSPSISEFISETKEDMISLLELKRLLKDRSDIVLTHNNNGEARMSLLFLRNGKELSESARICEIKF